MRRSDSTLLTLTGVKLENDGALTGDGSVTWFLPSRSCSHPRSLDQHRPLLKILKNHLSSMGKSVYMCVCVCSEKIVLNRS